MEDPRPTLSRITGPGQCAEGGRISAEHVHLWFLLLFYDVYKRQGPRSDSRCHRVGLLSYRTEIGSNLLPGLGPPRSLQHADARCLATATRFSSSRFSAMHLATHLV